MRIGSLTPLVLIIGATVCGQAQATSDNICYPTWSVSRDSLDVCSNVPFLSPGNDSRVNLRLLIADQKREALKPEALDENEQSDGYGPVPFAVSRLVGDEIEGDESEESGAAAMSDLLEQLGINRESNDTAGQAFLQGEGSRCRSNRDESAADFIGQLMDTPALSDAERHALARSRLQLLSACTWDVEKQTSLLPTDIQSAEGQAFLTYLRAASDFYSGRFSEAEKGFASLADSTQPWLKETSLYMVARTRLNAAQEQAYDQYGGLTNEVDPAICANITEALNQYLGAYPSGRYRFSATGLLRRVHWLAGDLNALAVDYTQQLTEVSDEEAVASPQALIQEADNKLLIFLADATPSPLITAIHDLMAMRADAQYRLTREKLLAQKALFAQQPAMFDYLQAAFTFYVEKNPAEALKLLPQDLPDTLDYLAFSQQTLRALALEASNDLPSAQALWLQLLPLAQQPLQREQLELALAMNYERSGQLAKVFASDSPIQSAQLRLILLDKVADAPLLRQQVSQGISDNEKATAQFVLLYKDLLRSQYAAFIEDLKALPETPSETKLNTSLGYIYENGQTLQVFRWNGDKAESGYVCPSIGETAARLQANDKDPKGLNCLGEFILRNALDGMPLEQKPAAGQLGSSESAFKGQVFSRLNGYQTVIADTKAARDDKAYALFRAINCYAPAGYNSCGGKEVAPAVRKAWFKQLKTTYSGTTWGQSLQYYW